jgi:hypothetical protein
MNDDDKYVALMSKYKELRLSPDKREEAQRHLDLALKLAERGKVSKDALIGGAYL